MLAWAVFGKLDIIASAEGRLIQQTYVKIVQPADAGIVQDILVNDGQAVETGQILIRMDTQLTDADANTIHNDVRLKSLLLRRVDAELAGQPMTRREDDPPALYAQIENQYRARLSKYSVFIEFQLPGFWICPETSRLTLFLIRSPFNKLSRNSNYFQYISTCCKIMTRGISAS